MALWRWLSNTDNQKTLAFVGAGIAGAVALLVQLGVLGKKEVLPATAPAASHPAAPTPTPAQAPPPSVPEASQRAEASSGGTAVNIKGDGNNVSLPAKR
ncbi:hypothetical protein GCM10007933_08210 [Zoogloea oryzae]|uniref:Uncharacterized protein n=1 Tax=Zoogloea oryzae TaxID=310767 RepID=A0ABQ6F812_9RHOO|nr:hypothetical protein GCM10007933_08210 [Zoogloea oryzae]